MVKEIWKDLVPSCITIAFYQLDFRDWMLLNLADAAVEGTDWCNI